MSSRTRTSLQRLTVALATGCLGLVTLAQPAFGAEPVRVGRAPVNPEGSRVVGSLASSTPISALVALKPQDGLAAYAQAVSTPGSPEYGDYLTPAEFRARFGARAATIARVDQALRNEGLSPGTASANGLTIPVTAMATTIGQAFATSFQRVELSSGRVAFANTAAPQFDASVAATVQGVVGLDSLSRAHPLGIHGARAGAHAAHSIPRVVTGGPQPCTAASAAATNYGAYTADELASAYEFSSLYGAGDTGAGQTVALYELEPNSASDIAAYQSCYGTSASVSDVEVDGGAGTGSGSGEAALDIEDVIGLAPSASILVYQGPNTNSGAYDTYLRIVTDDAAKVISTSWGLCEAQEGSSAAAAENTLFQEAAVQGQSIFAAAGDTGSQDCTDSARMPLSGLAVDDPASQPYVTGVGGTELSAIGPPPTQSVWNDGSSGGAGGGGVSELWKMPSYQSGASSSLNVINSNSSRTPCGATAGGYCREVPDVSADADENTGYVVYVDGAWTAYGGTSAAAPLWAAFTALTNASSACGGTPIGFANPALYSSAASGYTTDFSDITSGNDNLSGSGLYPAGNAYDMASGLGTPIGSALSAALCAAAAAGVDGANTVSVADPGSQTTTVGTAASLQIDATDTNSSQTLSYSATGLPVGLTINSATGVISGTPTTTGGTSVIVTATDSTDASGSATFTWAITPAPTPTPSTQTTTTPIPTSTTATTSTTPSTPTSTTTTATTTTTSARFYRCAQTCTLLNTHGATIYRARRADYGRYIKVVTTVTRTTGGVASATTSSRWVGPISASTAGDIRIGTGARAAATMIIRGSRGRALARVQVTQRHGSRLTLVVRREGTAPTDAWAYVIARGRVVSCTRTLSVSRPRTLSFALKRGQTVRLVAVRT